VFPSLLQRSFRPAYVGRNELPLNETSLYQVLQAVSVHRVSPYVGVISNTLCDILRAALEIKTQKSSHKGEFCDAPIQVHPVSNT
jgi:hypothetical protein